MGVIFALITQVVASLPSLIAAGHDISELVSSARAVIDEHRVPGDPEWDKLDAAIVAAQTKPGGLRDTSKDTES